jgi:hypothetical protein
MMEKLNDSYRNKLTVLVSSKLNVNIAAVKSVFLFILNFLNMDRNNHEKVF